MHAMRRTSTWMLWDRAHGKTKEVVSMEHELKVTKIIDIHLPADPRAKRK